MTITDSPTMQELLSPLSLGQTLTEQQAYQAFEHVMAGRATDAQIGALLTALAVRSDPTGGTGPTVDELSGAAQAMRHHAMKIDVPDGLDVIDTCGTGGLGSETFNISTAAALIAAGGGAHVAKHGNRSVTSKSGSSQVLEALGVNLSASSGTLSRCLAEARICFCFAPTHHPAMKHAIGPRKELGFRTVFNLLGPLTNPAGAERQVIGVSDPALTEPFATVLGKLGAKHAMVAHGDPDGAGLDELSTTGPSRLTTLRDGELTTVEIAPEELGLERVSVDELRVDGVEQSAAVIRSVLAGEKNAARQISALNAAAALLVAGIAEDWHDALRRAFDAIDRGDARQALDRLVTVSREP